MKEDNKDKTWKDKTGRKYQSYGVEKRLEQTRLEEEEVSAEPAASGESGTTLPGENEAGQDTTDLQEPGLETAEVDQENIN